jgi:acyl-coenzyme A synthetase/AMP-(fatty) acid ligase/acyl carrier protein
LLRVLLDSFVDLQKRLFDLKIWISSGEEISVKLAQRFRQVMPEAKLINLYGSSEVSADVTYYEVTDGRQHRCIPIGRPIDNTSIYILDSHLQPLPIGVPGELYISGDGLSRGYLNSPGLTAERFIHDPFTDDTEARLYKTGDLARYLPDGNIEFLGRLDHQVKIRGSRIEFGEIEAVLSLHPKVKQAVVIAREDILGDKRLAAYVISNKKKADLVSDLRSFLKQKLPDYMLPSSFTFLDCLPLNPSGKVNRKALPVPDQTRADLGIEYLAPRTPIEKLLAEIWSEVLAVEKVGIHDNFFELGGHSLLATQVLSRIRDALQMDIPLRLLFESPTVSDMAEAILQKYTKQIEQEELNQMLSDLQQI